MKRRIKRIAISPAKAIYTDLRDFKHKAQGSNNKSEKPSVRSLKLDFAALQPHQHTARSVKSTRERLGVTQSVFAMMIGASPELVEGWEAGTHWPTQMACHLIDAINAHPEVWTERLDKAAKLRKK